MTLYFADTAAWTVREVQGEPWPGKDNEGNQCFENTHFKTRNDAIDRLLNEASAYMIMSGREVMEAEKRLQIAQIAAAESVKVWAKLKNRQDKEYDKRRKNQ